MSGLSQEVSGRLAGHSDTAAKRLRHWLLHGPAQIVSGAEAGAIAGTVSPEGRPDYAYGEITGYYLHWLAGSHLRTVVPDSVLAAKASAALAWCECRLDAPDRLPTRIDLATSGPPDWRNQAVFCFDLAMLLGGLNAAAQRGLAKPSQFLLERLVVTLAGFARSDGLVPARLQVGADELPDRWSTRSGPFLVKAAARILAAGAAVELPDVLQRACHTQLQRFAHTPPQPWADPLHPTLYFLEGEMALAPQRDGSSVRLLQQLLAVIAADGNLPEAHGQAVWRADVVAQALRLGLLLRTAAVPEAPDDGVLDCLAANLVRRVMPDGAIAFREEVEPLQRNIWCALFAEQALSWHAAWRVGKVLPGNALELV